MNEILERILMIGGISIGGTTIGAIIISVIYMSLKSAFNKTIAKINVEKIAEKATDKGIERVKKITFSHNIQPLVESGLEKVNEKVNEKVDKKFANMELKQDRIIDCIEKLAAYFDDSIVPDEKKKDLKDALERAKEEVVTVESVVVEETTEVEEKSNVAPLDAVKTQVKVER